MLIVQVEAPAALQRHLIMVAGHSVYRSHNFSEPEENANWYLLDYQRVPGQAKTFVEHIKIGVLVCVDSSVAHW